MINRVPEKTSHCRAKMSSFLVLIQIVSFFLLLTVLEPAGTTTTTLEMCKPTRCRKHGPVIRFPFRLINSQPQQCGFSPAFDLHCDTNGETILQLPVSVNVSLSMIDYRSQSVVLYDPDVCLYGKLHKMNLSSSPFNFETEQLFILFNCSFAPRVGSGYPVSCLGSKGDRLYYVSPLQEYRTLIFYTRLHQIIIPEIPINGREWPPLHWSTPDCSRCESNNQFCSFNVNATGGDQIQCIRASANSPSKRPLIAGVCAAVSSVLGAGALYYIYRSRKIDQKIEKFLKDYEALKPTRFLYADLRRITKDFSEKLGEGGYGIVYKGKLSKEIYVAVKVLNSTKGNGEEFINEVGTIGSIHHVNIVRLVGFCADGFRRALVYEYLPNDSLDKFIFQSGPRRNSFTWEKIQLVATGIAKGIEYLHEGCDQQILHCDIKPHNILLDHNLNPKICDFGLAKFCSKEESAVSMTDARGTMGYISPEMMSRTFGRVSHKSDVYSFGMMLLEMVGGRKNRDVTRDKKEVYYPKWIYNQLSQGDNEMWVKIDDDGCDQDGVVRKLVVVGLWCIQCYPEDRPSMKMVIQMLEGDRQNLGFPPNPFPGINVSSDATVNRRCYGAELAAVPESDDNSF